MKKINFNLLAIFCILFNYLSLVFFALFFPTMWYPDFYKFFSMLHLISSLFIWYMLIYNAFTRQDPSKFGKKIDVTIIIIIIIIICILPTCLFKMNGLDRLQMSEFFKEYGLFETILNFMSLGLMIKYHFINKS